MLRYHVLVPFFGIALGTVGLALAQSPVPTRIRTDLIGSGTGTPTPVALTLAIDASGPRDTLLRIDGGTPLALAGLILGMQPTSIQLPYDALLLVDPVTVVAGTYDLDGKFGVPFDLTNVSFIGTTFWSQGLNYVPEQGGGPAVEVFQTSPALMTAVHPGNDQPPLGYVGPTLTATLIVKATVAQAPNYEVLSSIRVPTSGWKLSLSAIDRNDGVTAIYAILEEPNPDEIVLPMMENKRLLAFVGMDAEPRIQVLIERRVRGRLNPPVFRLAAELLRDF